MATYIIRNTTFANAMLKASERSIIAAKKPKDIPWMAKHVAYKTEDKADYGTVRVRSVNANLSYRTAKELGLV